MSWGLVVELRGADYRDQVVVLEDSCIPIKIGFGENVFPIIVRRKIDVIPLSRYYSQFFLTDLIILFIPLVELIVGGPMYMWPRIVLDFLFNFPPTSFSVGALASFLYGNGLPRSMALHLVRVS